MTVHSNHGTTWAGSTFVSAQGKCTMYDDREVSSRNSRRKARNKGGTTTRRPSLTLLDQLPMELHHHTTTHLGVLRYVPKAAHGFFTRTSWCPYPSAPASGCARTGPVPVPRCAPTRLLLVPRARATRSYSFARYLLLLLLARYSFGTRPLLVRYS